VVTAENINSYVKITVKSNSNPVTHYYVAKPKEAIIYMATNNRGEVSPGELRFLARLRTSEVSTGVHGDVGDNRGCTAIEGKDTFRCTNGHTSCKMYTSDRFMEDRMHCVSGLVSSRAHLIPLKADLVKRVQVCMVIPGVAYETSSGGPFMRDINSQTTSDDQELYWYMNSGHVRTEDWRSGLQGPYAMAFTAAGTKPSENLDTSFFGSLNIDGYVGESGRGSVTGKTTGVPEKFETVVHWYNGNAQYWTKAQGGNYKSPLMKPGSYSVKMYKGEFLVANDTVIVAAGQIATKDMASNEATPAVIWRIGEFDGQPFELKNGDKITRMHPSDVRMGSWGGAYTIGSSNSSDFPMALWSKQAGTATVNFQLTSSQIRAHVLRIGTTLSFKGGRPFVKIGSWSGSDPGVPVSVGDLCTYGTLICIETD
jgi:rhamnogalacturonan endolyase